MMTPHQASILKVRRSTLVPRILRAISSYEMACVAAVTGLLLSCAVAVGL